MSGWRAGIVIGRPRGQSRPDRRLLDLFFLVPNSNPSPRSYDSQLVRLLPVGISNLVMLIPLRLFDSLSLKSPISREDSKVFNSI